MSAPATSKGLATREMIVERAYAIASRHGFEGLSIGELANAAGMSKSGVFAHFGSREDLQLTVLDWTAQRFAQAVVRPALQQPRGIARLRAIMEGCFDWIRANPDGCVMLGAAGEYDARPGVMHDRVTRWLTEWRAAIAKAVQMCVESGDFAADTDADLASFQLFSITTGLHNTRFYDAEQAEALARRAVDHLFASYAA